MMSGHVDYVPYRGANPETRAKFHERAVQAGMLRETAPRRWTCGRCKWTSVLGEMGIAYGDKSVVGLPVCPSHGCPAVGWEHFEENSLTPIPIIQFHFREFIIECIEGEHVTVRRERAAAAVATKADVVQASPGRVTSILGPVLENDREVYKIRYQQQPPHLDSCWPYPMVVDASDIITS